MSSFKVTLAETPAHVLFVLGERPRQWAELRDCSGARSYDMNLLVELGFVRRDDFGGWQITEDGIAALNQKQG